MAVDLSARREAAREQEQQVLAQATNVAIEMAKPYVRFQSELLSTWANNAQVFAKMFSVQTEAFAQYTQDQAQQLGQASQQQSSQR